MSHLVWIYAVCSFNYYKEPPYLDLPSLPTSLRIISVIFFSAIRMEFILPKFPCRSVRCNAAMKVFFLSLPKHAQSPDVSRYFRFFLMEKTLSVADINFCAEDALYNDSVCFQRFCCKIAFAVVKKLDRVHLKHQ